MRPFCTAELETLLALTSTWATTRHIVTRIPGRVGMRALANRLAALEVLGAAERRRAPGKGRQSEWRRCEETKRRAA